MLWYFEGMEKGKNNWLSNFLAGVMPDNLNVDFKFEPFDNKLIELAWESPNDSKKNLVQVLMNPRELDRIEIKDTH